MGRPHKREYKKTPRTDERIVEIHGKEYVYAAFARELETELNEMKRNLPHSPQKNGKST